MVDSVIVPIRKKFITPVLTDIRTCWDVVREGLDFILEQNPHFTYRPEDVYSECVNNRAMLFHSPVGFAILTIQPDAFTGEKTLVLWIAYSFEHGNHHGLDHIDWIEEVAKDWDCKSIEVQSAVPELKPYLTNNGWSLEAIIYKREVKNDGS